MNKIINVIRLMRPKQWAKNIFVFTGLIFSGELINPTLTTMVLFAAIAFALASSSIYVLNDIIDRESDKYHPEKKYRPIASGEVSLPVAATLSILLLFAALGLSSYVSKAVVIIILIYIALNIAYSLKLKSVVILDVFCISAGFMLRILAGTIGVGIQPSNWLLLCGLMITLFLGFSKRRAEMLALKRDKEQHRKVLDLYGAIFLDEIIAICATGVILAYSLYTMSPETIHIHHTENLIYTVPFVIYALFRYIYILHHVNKAGDPSTDLFCDKHIVASVVGWAALTIILFNCNCS